MLDNLVNANLGGITGHINYDLVSAVGIQAMVGFLSLVVILAVVAGIFSGSKTNRYRKMLVDMYVAGTVRKLATKEGIDLEEEYKLFVRKEKKKSMEEKSLDRVIEMEKAEEYIDEQDKKTSKK